MLRKILLIIATYIAMTLPAPVAADFDKAVTAFSSGDYATALEEFRPLAEAGHVVAQYNLGVMHERGEGTPQDYQKAFTWYQRAAEQGYTSAQYNLGNMYRKGNGTPQNYRQALTWYKKAAEQGNIFAQNNLGLMYSKGEGTPQNFVFGYMWFNISAANGNEVAIENRDLSLKHLTPAQIAEGQRLSSECIAKNLKNCP